MSHIKIATIGKKPEVIIEKESEIRYIRVKDVFMRIRLDNHFDDKDIKINETIDLENEATITSIDMGQAGTTLVNGKKNMNSFVVASKADKLGVLYLIIDSSCKILHVNYKPGTICKSNYYDEGKDTGCLISYNKANRNILTLFIEQNGEVYQYSYFVGGSDSVIIRSRKLTDIDFINTLKNRETNKTKSGLFINSYVPFTEYFITKKDKHNELLNILHEHNDFKIKNPIVLDVEQDNIELIVKELKERKVKVVSVYECTLPIKIESMLTAIFNLTKEGKTRCIKSN